MERTDRREFLKHSTTAAVAGAALSTTNLSPAARSAQEIAEWEARVGSRMLAGDAELTLKSVTATDHSRDPARPRHLRTHSIALLFTVTGGRMDGREHHYLQQNGHELLLSEVVPPEGTSGRFVEAILN